MAVARDARRVAAELRRGRDAAGLTQEALADRSSLSVRTIRDLEAGRVSRPRRSSLVLLAEALGRDPGWLVNAAGEPTRARRADPLPLPPLPDVGVGGRSDLLGQVSRALTPGARAGLSGPPGVGKSTLAAAVADAVRDRFELVLWLDLRGFSRPRSTVDALRALISAVDPSARLSVDDQPSLEQRWRQAVAGRSLLLVLDNASDEQAVRPLLPEDRGATALVTARRPLMVVEPSHLFVVEPLGPHDAAQLFRAWVGAERTAANPAAVQAVVTACGGLPLAVRVAAARLASRPRWRVDDLVVRLRRDDQRLDQLRFGDLDVRASLESAYAELPPVERSALRALAALRTPEVPLWIAAALFGVSPAQAQSRCDALSDAGLLAAHGGQGPRRGESFVLHDLVRIMAAEHAWSPAEHDATLAAVRRAADAVCELLAPIEEDLAEQWSTPGGPAWAASRHRTRPRPQARGARAREDATRRFAAHYGAITAVVDIAVERLDPVAAVRVAQSVAAPRATSGLFRDWILTHEAVLARPDRERLAPDLAVCLLTSLGGAYLAHGNGPRAEESYRQAVAVATAHGLGEVGRHARLGELMSRAVPAPSLSAEDSAMLEVAVRREFAAAEAAGARWSAATAELTLSRLLGDTGRAPEAIARLEAFEADPPPAWIRARIALRLADLYTDVGGAENLDRALGLLVTARRFFAGRGLQVWIAAAWHTQSKVEKARGRPAAALRALQHSEAAFLSTGDQRWASYVRTSTAEVLLEAGETEAARTALTGAESVLRRLDDPVGLDRLAALAGDVRWQPVWAG